MSKKTMTPKTFQEKLTAARKKLGSVGKLYAAIVNDPRGVETSVPTIDRWMAGKSQPHPNNRKAVEAVLDDILAAK